MNVIPVVPAARPATLVYSTSTGRAPVSLVSEYVVSPVQVEIDTEAAWLMRHYGTDTRFTLYVQYSKYDEGSDMSGVDARTVASYLVDSAYYREVSWSPEVSDLRVFFPPVLWAS